MNAQQDTKTQKKTQNTAAAADFFGKLFSFNISLKLFHWHVTGAGSYAQHMALDQAIEQLSDPLDRIVETAYALGDNVDITVPETDVPSNIVEHASNFYNYIQDQRELFQEDFIDSILDDYSEAIQQLLYRLKRLQ